MPEPNEIDPNAAENLTPDARALRQFLQELGHYLGGVSAQLRTEHKESQANTVQGYANSIERFVEIPYSRFIPEPESKFAESVREVSDKAFPLDPPDLRTLEGARDFLQYHSPDPDARARHEQVNNAFQQLIDDVWDPMYDGPGKTVAVRAINNARMACNSVIANHGG